MSNVCEIPCSPLYIFVSEVADSSIPLIVQEPLAQGIYMIVCAARCDVDVAPSITSEDDCKC
jgi:hypothetical protein